MHFAAETAGPGLGDPAILEHLPPGLVLLATDGRVLSVNAQTLERLWPCLG